MNRRLALGMIIVAAMALAACGARRQQQDEVIWVGCITFTTVSSIDEVPRTLFTKEVELGLRRDGVLVWRKVAP